MNCFPFLPPTKNLVFLHPLFLRIINMLGYDNGCFILPSAFSPPFFCITAQFSIYKYLDGVVDYLCISTFLEWREFFIQIAIILREMFTSVLLVPVWQIILNYSFTSFPSMWKVAHSAKRQNLPFANPFRILNGIEDQAGRQRTSYQKL